MSSYIREPINSLTHLIGAILSCVAMIMLLYVSFLSGNMIKVVSAFIFAGGLIALYTASTVYHWRITTPKKLKFLRKIDHMMIYILIAATYTPVCLITLKGFVGYTMISVIWTLAISGIVLKMVWLNAPRWLYTSFYLILGWAAVLVIYPLYKALPSAGLNLLIAGGLSYTIGAVIYGSKSEKIKIWKFGFHEIFHIFIMLGSLLHFFMIYNYIVN